MRTIIAERRDKLFLIIACFLLGWSDLVPHYNPIAGWLFLATGTLYLLSWIFTA